MRIETAGVASKKIGNKFGVIVKSDDAQESFVYDVGEGSTLNQVELLAVKFAVLGVEGTQAIIATPNRYVYDMLQRDGNEWVKSPKSNAEIIADIRNVIETSNIQIILEKSDAAKDLCRKP